jgi:hypothetical protein
MRSAALIALILTAVFALPAPGWSAFRSITPEKAVIAAAKAAPDGVPGIFKMTVRAVGHENGRVFLNSELDYRDQRNLTIAMDEDVEKALEAKIGAISEQAFVGRRISVRGVAQRVRIDFTAGGRPPGKYYYQTHVVVATPVQVAVKDKL